MNPNNDTRVPPRFVPTLTEVVHVPEWVLPAGPLNTQVPWVAVDSPTETPSEPGTPVEASTDLPPPATFDAQTDEITRRVTAHLEQRLAALLEEQLADMARVLSHAVAQQLLNELPALVQQAVQASAAPATPWPVDGQ